MNWHDRRTAEFHDRARDLRKHDARPGERGFSPPDQNEPPARLAAQVSEAMEVAILAQAVPLQQAAELIWQYAQTVAEGAKLDTVAAIYNGVEAVRAAALETPLTRKVP